VKDWPQHPSRDPAVETARILAINVLCAMDGRSLRATKALTGVDHTTISAILQGKVWPDLQTISKLEAGLGSDLWPKGVASGSASARKTKR